MGRLALWALVALMALALPLQADMRPLAGQQDPAFQGALEVWLSGDEARALPALAGLAAADNRAAQVLLGLIDVTPQYQGRWLYALPWADRIALMRAPPGGAGGVSGQNWLRRAAADEPLAAAWVQLWDGNAKAEVMLEFARLGDEGAARTAAKRLARREAKGFGALADEPGFPAFAIGLAIRDWQTTDPARAKAALDALPLADPGRGLIGTYQPDPAAVLALARTDPALHLLDRHLVTLCPDPEGGEEARAQRLTDALEMLGGWWGLADLGPPAHVLIDPDRWVASAKGTAAFVRLLPDPDPQGAAGMDPCLANLAVLGAQERGALK
jgi:hypothetical protein